MKNDLKHLKWRLINQDGLTPGEADLRIKKIKKWERKSKRTSKRNRKSLNSSSSLK